MKKFRIIYIDTFDDFGHLALNKNYVKRLTEEGYDVTVAMSANCLKALAVKAPISQVIIPARFYKKNVNRLTERIRQVRILRYIRRNLPIESFDIVFYSNFDEIVLGFYRIALPSVLLVHANVANLENPIKLFFMRWVSRGNTLLVFHQYIRKKCFDYGISNVEVIGQGISAPFQSRTDERKRILREFDQRLVSSEYEYILFAPSGIKYSDRLLVDAIADSQFCSFLRDRRVLLVVKCNTSDPASKNILTINKRIEQSLYEALFTESRAVILNYPLSFSYRVSSILFECFSNDKMCLLTNIEAFRIFSNHIRYDPFFSNQFELTSAIDQVIRMDSSIVKNPFLNKESLYADFKFIRKLSI